ncbi:MAG: hypothetical protein JWQ45_1491 [Blastococcus sp.]|jgi:hypothetical protein|nr:hypothetical protein [Blastococcus sp.]
MQRGFRQAAIFLGASAVGATVAAGVWTAFSDTSYRVALAVGLMVMGGMLALTGSNAISRTGSMDAFAFLGMAPEHQDPDSGEGLTSLGVFLFVSLPLLVAGLALFGRG